MTNIFGGVPPFFDHPDRACKGKDTEMFFPEAGMGSANDAIAICRTCPFVDECAAWATPQAHLHGVWGALTAHDRTQLRQGKRVRTRAIPAASAKPKKRAKPQAPTVDTRTVVAQLSDEGLGTTDIARRLGYGRRTICRHLAAIREARAEQVATVGEAA